MKATPFEDAGRQVLIERVGAVEDSSRFWSIWMTLEHLRIVHHGIASTVGDLSNGVTPGCKVSTAGLRD